MLKVSHNCSLKPVESFSVAMNTTLHSIMSTVFNLRNLCAISTRM